MNAEPVKVRDVRANGAAKVQDRLSRLESLVTPVGADWYRTPPRARTWLLRDVRRPNRDGVFPLGKCGQLVASGGVGKTMLLSQLALPIACGGEWLGTFSAATPGRVLMLLGEEDAEETRRRLYNAARATATPHPDDGAIVVLPLAGEACALLQHDAAGNPEETGFLRWVRGFVSRPADAPWRLIVLDPLSRFAGLEAEKDNAEGTRFVQAVESLATATGASVLVSHHTSKPFRGSGVDVTGEASRGSSSLHDGFRWQATLGVTSLAFEDAETAERLGEIVTFANTKNNYARKAGPLVLRRDLANGGALIPCTADDLVMIDDARSGASTQATKRAAREAEREQTIAARERSKRDRRDLAEQEREAKRRERDAADDATVRAILGTKPDAPTRAIVAALRRERSCGSDRALAAVHRVKGAHHAG